VLESMSSKIIHGIHVGAYGNDIVVEWHALTHKASNRIQSANNITDTNIIYIYNICIYDVRVCDI